MGSPERTDERLSLVSWTRSQRTAPLSSSSGCRHRPLACPPIDLFQAHHPEPSSVPTGKGRNAVRRNGMCFLRGLRGFANGSALAGDSHRLEPAKLPVGEFWPISLRAGVSPATVKVR